MISYITGDLIAAAKEAKDIRILVHSANNLKIAGAGVIIPIFKTWPDASNVYQNIEAALGSVSLSKDDNVIVCNLIGQEGIGRDKRNEPCVRLWAIEKGFRKIRNIYDSYKKNGHKVRVMIPRICVGLGGLSPNKWPRVLQSINNGMPLGSYNLDVYTLEKEAKKFPNTPLRDLL